MISKHLLILRNAVGRIKTNVGLLWRSLVHKDPWNRYLLAEKITYLLYPRYRFSEYGRIFLENESFLNWYRTYVGDDNYHSLDRKFNLSQLLYLIDGTPGDTAECGVYKGASSHLICQHTRVQGRRHYLFDSFEGLSAPQAQDGSYWRKHDLRSPEALVLDCLSQFDFIELYTGWIPTRFNEVADKRFCFVHIDVDLYQPTHDSLEFFYPRLMKGGLILCDDAGFRSCPGAREAFFSFFSNKPEKVIELSSGQGFIIKVSS